MRQPMAATNTRWGAVVAVLLFAAMVLLASPPAPAAAAADIASQSASTTPGPTASPSPSPSPTETESDADRHQRQNGERPVERDDLGFLGILFVTGIGFVLVAGAIGVAVAGWKRRRRDRVAADTEAGE